MAVSASATGQSDDDVTCGENLKTSTLLQATVSKSKLPEKTTRGLTPLVGLETEVQSSSMLEMDSALRQRSNAENEQVEMMGAKNGPPRRRASSLLDADEDTSTADAEAAALVAQSSSLAAHDAENEQVEMSEHDSDATIARHVLHDADMVLEDSLAGKRGRSSPRRRKPYYGMDPTTGGKPYQLISNCGRWYALEIRCCPKGWRPDANRYCNIPCANCPR